MSNGSGHRSVFQQGFSSAISAVVDRMQQLYLADTVPWVVGYSGGKDSTAVLQLAWSAIHSLPIEKRHKPVHVITTDTLVENPIVAQWVGSSLESMRDAASQQRLPICPRLLRPPLGNRFWVNLIGKGYPAPRPRFRWCTERLKIKPTNTFIRDVVSEHGEVVLLLGVRTAESSARARSISRRKEHSVRDGLTVHVHLSNCLVYTPIEDWTNDDVWVFLMRCANPWGQSNKQLLSLYRGATEDNECPLVVDTSTPSCGRSRFGCWVCTLVDEDKSMKAMIQNDQEREWMLPLLRLRNDLDFRSDAARARDRERRDFRRMSGNLSHYRDENGEIQLVPGPYTQRAREHWLRQVLRAQRQIRGNPSVPEGLRDIELIPLQELQEVRRIWVTEKHEIEDILPEAYEEELGQPYPGPPIDENVTFGREALEMLREVCEGDDLRYELARNLLDVERSFRTMVSRRGLFDYLEKTIRRAFYDDQADAHERVKKVACSRQLKLAPMGQQEEPNGAE